jgi:type II secretory pathway component PulM
VKLVRFPGHNMVAAENQPQYLQLPAYREPEYGKNLDGELTCCWQLSWRERLRLLWSGKVWHTVLTFWDPLQPQMLSTRRPAHIPSKSPEWIVGRYDT